MNFKKVLKYKSITALLLAGCFVLASCGNNGSVSSTEGTAAVTAASETETETEAVYIDYAGQLKLDMNSDTLKQKVTVKTFVDGDTTHFNVPESFLEGGVIKARYLGINTPESTGKIEEYGKTAAAFTKEKLSNASSIIIESDDNQLNSDSTGSRYLLWIWYRNSEDEDYRNLNVEILQNGLAIASNSANNRYGQYCVNAIENARANKLNIYSGEKDPNFYYGDAQELTLMQLRTNIADYTNEKVAFEGVITRDQNNGVYVEEYDEASGLYSGIYIYYGFNLSGAGLEILSVGNRVRIVGTVQYYEAGGTYQVSGLTYRQMKPNDPGNIQKIGDGYEPAYVETDADTFINGTVTLAVTDKEGNESVKDYSYASIAMDTSISMKNLTVTDIYTTNNPDSSSNGAMTLTCTCDGETVTVRTDVLYDDDHNLVTAAAYMGKTIDVKGIVGIYDGKYQIKVLSAKDITINE